MHPEAWDILRPMPRPDFFLVGALKSGSTALYEQLRRHPQIFMPFHCEMPWAYAIRNRLVSANSVRQRRPEMDPDLHRRLTEEFAPEVAELGALIRRDLSAWSRLEQAR